MEGKVYVITHKRVNIPFLMGQKEYELIQTGDTNAPRIGYQTAAEGINIAYANVFYADLTVHYWIWKNISCDYIGINHYRRFFYYNGHVITGTEIEQLLNCYDVLVPQKQFCDITIQQQWNLWHRPDILYIAMDAIKELCPEYTESFCTIMQTKGLYICNIFIANKLLFDKYCEWVFPILAKVRARVNLDEILPVAHKRIGGFLSERLFNVWLHYNQLSTCELEFHVFSSNQFDI